MTSYGLPDALRLTVGTEEANRLVVASLADFSEAARAKPAVTTPVFGRLAVIGLGLIGTSVVRAARAVTVSPAAIVASDLDAGVRSA